MQTINGERKIRLAFFDVDGVLSAPQYPSGEGDLSIGFTTENWLAYCEEAREDSYMPCRPLPCVKKFASSLKAEGVKLYVLSTVFSEYEPAAKKKFIDTHYPGLFEEYIFVPEDLQKVDAILRTAEEYGCSPQECVLVEDTYNTLLAAYPHGITCVHLSNIIAGNISR